MASNEENARDIVELILIEKFAKAGGIRLDVYALSRQIVDSLAEVELIVDEAEEPQCCASCDGHSCD